MFLPVSFGFGFLKIVPFFLLTSWPLSLHHRPFLLHHLPPRCSLTLSTLLYPRFRNYIALSLAARSHSEFLSPPFLSPPLSTSFPNCITKPSSSSSSWCCSSKFHATSALALSSPPNFLPCIFSHKDIRNRIRDANPSRTNRLKGATPRAARTWAITPKHAPARRRIWTRAPFYNRSAFSSSPPSPHPPTHRGS